jgi:[NiFe] hydrogenase assembly HybE family chaperone
MPDADTLTTHAAIAAALAPIADDAAFAGDPSARLVAGFTAAAQRMAGLGFCNPALAVEAVGFAPWEGHWLGVVITPWFINLTLTARDPAQWTSLALGAKRRYRFPAGDYEFIGAHDAIAGEYQACSLFSPVLEFDDQASAREVARLAREALLDAANAEVHEMPVANLSPTTADPDGAASRSADDATPGPLAQIEAQLATPMSKRAFLRGGRPG